MSLQKASDVEFDVAGEVFSFDDAVANTGDAPLAPFVAPPRSPTAPTQIKVHGLSRGEINTAITCLEKYTRMEAADGTAVYEVKKPGDPDQTALLREALRDDDADDDDGIAGIPVSHPKPPKPLPRAAAALL